jgi:monofunctional chorismate mutase
MSDDQLKGLRAEIDHLDCEVIRLLGQRFSATEAVGRIKATQNLQAVDEQREAAQAQKYAEFARQFGVPDEVVQKLFRVVIDEVVRNHRAIRDGAESAE